MPCGEGGGGMHDRNHGHVSNPAKAQFTIAMISATSIHMIHRRLPSAQGSGAELIWGTWRSCSKNTLSPAAPCGVTTGHSNFACMLQELNCQLEDISNYSDTFTATCTARALTNLDMFVLEAEDFMRLADHYPRVFKELKQVAMR